MNLEELIRKYKTLINYSALASAIGILQGSFHEKLHNSRGNKFSPEQRQKLTEYLKELSSEIQKVDY